MSATHSAIHRNEREKRTRLSNTRELPPIIAPPAGLVRSMSHPLRRFYIETEFFHFFVSSTNYSAAATPERGADGRTGERTRCLAASAAIHFPLIKNQLIRCSFSCHNLLSIKIQSNFSLNWINFILNKLISFKLNQSLLKLNLFNFYNINLNYFKFNYIKFNYITFNYIKFNYINFNYINFDYIIFYDIIFYDIIFYDINFYDINFYEINFLLH